MTHPGRLRHVVGDAIVRHALWDPGARVAVAVSGGIDSVVLLDLLQETARWHRAGALEVVTVDHGTRPGSAGDADFVEALARDRGLAVVRATLALGPTASEAELRDGRYVVFDGLDVDRVALAHHRADLAETVLLHALRGTGTRGLAGMARRRGRYVRPLLDVPRARIEAWAAFRGLEHREDPTNQDLRFLRNRVRREVLPVLEAVRPGAEGALARTARHAAADDALLERLALEAWPHGAEEVDEVPVDWVATTPEPLVRRGLRRVLPLVTSGQLDAVLDLVRRGATGVVEIDHVRRFEIGGGRVRWGREEGADDPEGG